MIIRIIGEGQFRLPGSSMDDLDKIDNQIVDAVAVSDEGKLASLLSEMHDLILNHGSPLLVDEFVESDLIVPGTDLTLSEAESIFSGVGLVTL